MCNNGSASAQLPTIGGTPNTSTQNYLEPITSRRGRGFLGPGQKAIENLAVNDRAENDDADGERSGREAQISRCWGRALILR